MKLSSSNEPASCKRPTAAQLDLGEPAVVLHQSSFGVFLEDSNGDIRKSDIGSNFPNGALHNSEHALGEGWLDTNDNLSKFGVEVNGFLLAVVVAVGPRILKILVWKLAV